MEIKQMSFWKWLGLLLAGFFLATLLYGVASLVVMIPHGWMYCVACLAISLAMLFLYAVFVRWFESQPAMDLPLWKAVGDTGLGLGIGLGYFCVVTGVMALLGAYSVTGYGAAAMEILCSFCFFSLVAVGEELMFRGVLFRWIDEKWGFAAALAVSSLFFGLVHISQPGATLWSSIAIAIEAGLLLGAAYKYAGSLWLPIGIHWAWNFTEGNIFGFSVSGGDGGASLITPVLSGSDLLTGGIFGAEASLIAPILGVMLSVWFIILSLPGLKSRI